MNEKTKIGLSDATLRSEERDKTDKWNEVMALAEKYCFIRFAYAGFAMLSIDEEAMKVK